MTLSEAQRFQNALRRQMHFWVTLLFLDLLAVTLLIVGKAASWKWLVTLNGHHANLAWIMVFVVTFVSALAILRMLPFVKGVLSLLELNGWLVRRAIEAAENESSPLPVPPSDLDIPDGYGKILPHVSEDGNIGP